MWAAALWLLTARLRNPLAVPLALVAATLLVHGVLTVFGLLGAHCAAVRFDVRRARG